MPFREKRDSSPRAVYARMRKGWAITRRRHFRHKGAHGFKKKKAMQNKARVG